MPPPPPHPLPLPPAEQLIRLPGCFLCYTPPDAAPPVAPLPALQNGFVTFGSFNALAKQTPEVRGPGCQNALVFILINGPQPKVRGVQALQGRREVPRPLAAGVCYA